MKQAANHIEQGAVWDEITVWEFYRPYTGIKNKNTKFREAAISTEMSINFYQSILRHIL